MLILGVFVALVVAGNVGSSDEAKSYDINAANTYKPVFLMHGFNETQANMAKAAQWIAENHPTTIVHTIPFYEGPKSTADIWDQIDGIWDFIQSTADGDAAFDDGYHFVCHSLAGLTCRGIAQTKSDHNFDQIITLATPHVGLYGCSDQFKGLIPCPAVPTLYLPFTTPPLREISVAEIWHDPNHEEEFLQGNIFLPVINHLSESANDDRSPISPSEYKQNFLKVGGLVAFGSPEDSVVIPWDTALFSFPDDQGEIVPYTDREEYVDDTYGLKSLDEDGRLTRVTVPGVGHHDWVQVEDVFVDNVLDYLT